MRKYIPNFLTTIRIMCSIALVFCQPLSHIFISIYVIAGVSDILDGKLARRFDVVSSFGEKYDSVADLAFVGVCLTKLLPIFEIPLWGILWIAFIAIIKILNILISYCLYKNKLFLHTIANKVTGAILFLTPLALIWIPLEFVLIVVCFIASFAAIQEGFLFKKGGTKMTELKVTSPAFNQDDWIPNCNSGFGEDFSPEIHIEGIDSNAISIVITMDDLDHPIKPGYNHWVAWNIPPMNVIPEHLPKGAIVDEPFHLEQGLAYGKHCYRGPKPPFNWNHRYCFTIYILDAKIDINTNSKKANVLKAMEGHVLQKGCLIGKYQKKHK